MFGAIKAEEECKNSDPMYWKDDSNQYEQYGYAILFVYVLGLTIKNFTNIAKLIRVKRHMSITKLLSINLTILVINLLSLVLYADGIASLFFDGGYLSLAPYYVLRQSSIYWLQIIFTFSWYLWMPVLAITYDKPRKTIQKGAYIFGWLFFLAFAIQGGFTVDIVLRKDICDLIKDKLQPLELSTMASIISITLNDIIFVISAYLLTKKIRLIFEYRNNKQISYMRLMAFMTFYGTCFRIIYNIMFYVKYLQADFQRNGNKDGATVKDQIIWVLNYYFIDFSCTLIPITFLLNNFCARVKPSKIQDQLDSQVHEQDAYQDLTTEGERTISTV